MHTPQAVLFDLDGTLTNTLADIAGAMNRALSLFSLPPWDTEDYKLLVGDGARVLVKRAVRERQDLAGEVLQAYQSWYETHNLETTQPYPHIQELLQALTQRGLRLCVFSNKPHQDTVRVVRHFFPDTDFQVIRGQQEGVPVKPDPTGALAVAQEIGVPPEDFFYLGDTGVDMACARRAGMHPVGVLWGFRQEQELREAGAEAVLEHPMALLPLLFPEE